MNNKKHKRIVKVFTFKGEKERLITIAIGVENMDFPFYGDMWGITIEWRVNKSLGEKSVDAIMGIRPSMNLIEAYANDCYRYMMNHPEEFYILSKKSVKEELELKEKSRKKEQEKIDNAESARKNKEAIDSFLNKKSKTEQAVKAEVKKREKRPISATNPMLADNPLANIESKPEPRKKRRYVRKNKEYWADIDSGANTRGRHAKKSAPILSE